MLKLMKNVRNDSGGTAAPDGWTLSVAAAAPNDGRNFSNPGGSGAFQPVYANVGYVLSESTVPGYAGGSWQCDAGKLDGSTITLGYGDNTTCTITNDDQQAYITLKKVVNNLFGGTAQPDDFRLTLEGEPVGSGVAAPNSCRARTRAGETLPAGDHP